MSITNEVATQSPQTELSKLEQSTECLLRTNRNFDNLLNSLSNRLFGESEFPQGVGNPDGANVRQYTMANTLDDLRVGANVYECHVDNLQYILNRLGVDVIKETHDPSAKQSLR